MSLSLIIFLMELLTLKEKHNLSKQEADTEFLFVQYFYYRIKEY